MLPVFTGKEDRYPSIFGGTGLGFLDLECACDTLKVRNVVYYKVLCILVTGQVGWLRLCVCVCGTAATWRAYYHPMQIRDERIWVPDGLQLDCVKPKYLGGKNPPSQCHFVCQKFYIV